MIKLSVRNQIGAKRAGAKKPPWLWDGDEASVHPVSVQGVVLART